MFLELREMFYKSEWKRQQYLRDEIVCITDYYKRMLAQGDSRSKNEIILEWIYGKKKIEFENEWYQKNKKR